MSRRLKHYVHVEGVSYGPLDDVPADVAAGINDWHWEDVPDGPAATPAEVQDFQARLEDFLAEVLATGNVDVVLRRLQDLAAVSVPVLPPPSIEDDEDGPLDGDPADEENPGPSPVAAPSTGTGTGTVVGVVPPKSGKGSSTKAWADFATANGIKVDEEDGRDDIIAKLEAAGKPTDPPAE